jgi:hypothetical protein
MGGRSLGRLVVLGALVGAPTTASAQIGSGVAAVTLGACWYIARGQPRAPSSVLGRSGARGVAAIGWSV